MKYFLKSLVFVALLFTSLRSISQPLPCPPLSTTSITGIGGTTICNGGCTTISCTDTTSIKSTSSYTFSTIPYLPTSFTGGTSILVGTDDVYSGVLALPFPFCFYGVKYNSCLIGANGEICFNTSLAGGGCPWSIPGPIPTPGSLNAATINTIMGAYYDLDPSIPGGTTTWAIYGTAPCRTFVVSWNNIPLFNAGTCPGLTGTQQIVLYESTYAIDIFIHNKPICDAWNSGRGILGIVDQTGANYNLAPGKNGTSFGITDSGYRFTPNGPATWRYVWTDPTGTVVGTTRTATVCPTVATVYTVTGIASSNCDSFMVRSSVLVQIGRNPNISRFTRTNPSLCGVCDGSIKLFGLVPGSSDTIYYKYNGALQPYVVQITAPDSSLTITGLCSGRYDSIVVKEALCHTDPIGPIILTDPPIAISSVTTTNPLASCTCDGTITLYGLYPSHAFTVNYDFNGIPQPPVSTTTTTSGTITLTGLCAGRYSNIVASFGACITPPRSFYDLVAPAPYVFNVKNKNNPTQCGYCDGDITIGSAPPFSTDTIRYSLNGAPQPPIVTIALSDSSIYLPGLCAGDYTGFTVTVGPCTFPVGGSALLSTIPVVANFNMVVKYGCNGDTVYFTNNSTSAGTLFYTWNFGDGTSDTTKNPMHIFSQGTYTVTLTSTNHYCVDSFKLPLDLVHPIKAIFGASPTLLCQNNPVVFTDSSIGTGLSYAWYFGNGATSTVPSPVYSYQKTGLYKAMMIITDFVPCLDTAMVDIQVDTISGIKMAITDTVICRSTDMHFTALYTPIGNTGITWDMGDGYGIKNVNPLIHSYDAVGVFTVTATAHYRACKDTTASRKVVVIPQPNINLGDDTFICPGSEPIILGDRSNANNPNATWKWNTGQTTRTIAVSTPGYYFATVNINNCITSDTVWVKNDCYMNIPNVFSPNGDGVNDYFFPRQMLTSGLVSFKMQIFNRWGQIIFESSSLDGSGWDGRFNGVDQPVGVYVYVIDGTFRDGQKEHHQGNVTMLR